MTISITRFSVLLLLGGNLVLPFAAYAEGSPHWSKSRCQDCHVEAAPVDGVVNLQEADAEALCEACHGSRGDAKACRHMSGIPAGDVQIAEGLTSSLENGEIVCTTCHDIVYQCKHARADYRLENPSFLRDPTSRRAGDYCFKCHVKSDYERLNPHQGVAGSPPRPTCPLCHESIPEADGSGGIRVTFNMQRDLNDACRGCHVTRPHPRKMFSFSQQEEDRWVHLVEPTPEVLARMQRSEASIGVSLPLNPENGEIFCATCHDPHEFKGGPVAEQPKERLRADNICQVCHEK